MFEEVILEDVSEYEQIGSNFGAGDINRTNQAVNEKFDADDVVDPLLTTEKGFAADAYITGKHIKEQKENLTASNGVPFKFGVIENGEYGHYVTDSEGADTFNPFKNLVRDTPATATAAMITEGFTAWVNGELITGTRPLPVNTQSGSKSYNAIGWGNVIDFKITFPKEFDSVPSVSLAGSTCASHDFDQLKVLSVNRAYFTGRFEPGGTPGLGNSNVVIRWTASA